MKSHPHGPSFWELCHQALSSTRDGYDLLAPKFDHTPYRTPPDLVDAVVDNLPKDAHSVLDVCCGTGAGLEKLLLNKQLKMITGVDFSPAMLEQARNNLENHDDRLELIEADVLTLDYNNQFDTAICLGALGHFVGADYELLLRRIHDALKPGGQYLFPIAPAPKRFSKIYWFCLAFNLTIYARNLLLNPPFTMYYHDMMFESDGLQNLLKQVGFDIDIVNASTEACAASDGLVRPGFKIMIATKHS